DSTPRDRSVEDSNWTVKSNRRAYHHGNISTFQKPPSPTPGVATTRDGDQPDQQIPDLLLSSGQGCVHCLAARNADLHCACNFPRASPVLSSKRGLPTAQCLCRARTGT